MDIFATANQKGGVGKTATTVNLGAALAEEGRRVLLVDFDPQGHLSEALGVPETPDDRTLCGWLLGEWTGDPREMIASHRDRLDVLPTHLDMALMERGLYMKNNRERRLSRLLEHLEDDYDVCVVDCAPSLGVITDCALMAARRRPGRRGGVIVPVEAEDSSIRALRLLLRQIGVLSAEMDIDLDVLGLVPSRYDLRDGRLVTGTLAAFRDLGTPPVLAEIRKRTDVREAWRARVSVLEYAPTSEVAGWYRDLAKAVYA
ncbi:ParA family protein [Kitasatospora sp. NPDC018058]|uniref:ParA family protein n=1 Tax=Kitasatospora sp. NPDC018058 TaxID=3364025 RepID=UPI0037BECAFD